MGVPLGFLMSNQKIIFSRLKMSSGSIRFWKRLIRVNYQPLFRKTASASLTKRVDLEILQSRRIQSNKIEPKFNRTQLNTNRSIEFGNRTKSNIYFAVSSIIEPIEENRTQSNSIRFDFVRNPFLK